MNGIKNSIFTYFFLVGADLQAVLSTAHMIAVKETIGEESLYSEFFSVDSEETKSSVKSTSEHNRGSENTPAVYLSEELLIAAIGETKPSVSAAERAKYEKLHKKLEKRENSKESEVRPEQRATLA